MSVTVQSADGEVMHFDLKAPCRDCPFRTDVEIIGSLEWFEELLASHKDYGKAHTCHLTDPRSPDVKQPGLTQHCAGYAIMMKKENKASMALVQAMSQDLSVWDGLDMSAPVYNSFEDFTQAHIHHFASEGMIF